MNIGLPKETKTSEYRVAITPSGVERLTQAGHRVYVESNAGVGSGYSNLMYEQAGAAIVGLYEVWNQPLIVKVKEPLGTEFGKMQSGQVIFTYLHLAASKDLTLKLLEKNVIAYAYETVQLEDGSLPLLVPMSEVAGKLSVQAGAYCLEAAHGGKGVLLGGVTGVYPANVTILGAGVAGTNATMVAHGMGARVTVLDINEERLSKIQSMFTWKPGNNNVYTIKSNPKEVEHAVVTADLVISTILIRGAKAPKLITRQMLTNMECGSAFVDVSIDQGGAAESSMATTHTNPTYVECGVVHYCVANMPGAVPYTSTRALTNATLPYILDLANNPLNPDNPALVKGLNIFTGRISIKEVAEAHNVNVYGKDIE
jgi:alanine dehydrogenase